MSEVPVDVIVVGSLLVLHIWYIYVSGHVCLRWCMYMLVWSDGVGYLSMWVWSVEEVV